MTALESTALPRGFSTSSGYRLTPQESIDGSLDGAIGASGGGEALAAVAATDQHLPPAFEAASGSGGDSVKSDDSVQRYQCCNFRWRSVVTHPCRALLEVVLCSRCDRDMRPSGRCSRTDRAHCSWWSSCGCAPTACRGGIWQNSRCHSGGVLGANGAGRPPRLATQVAKHSVTCALHRPH